MKVIFKFKEYEICDECYNDPYGTGKPGNETIMKRVEIADEHGHGGDILEYLQPRYEFAGKKYCSSHKQIAIDKWWMRKREKAIRLGMAPDNFLVLLNSYQIMNLRWVMHLIWRGFGPSFNTGDWSGEIPTQLDKLIEYYKAEFSRRASNTTFKDWFEGYGYKQIEKYFTENYSLHDLERMEGVKKELIEMEEKWKLNNLNEK